MGYVGAGIAIWAAIRCAKNRRRERWLFGVDHATTLHLAALVVARALAGTATRMAHTSG